MATILISTADPGRAGRLQRAFEPDDQVRFVTSAQDVREALESAVDDEAALILTGEVRERPAGELISAVSDDGRHVAVVALFAGGEIVPSELVAELRIDEGFAEPIDPDEVALVVRRLIDRKRLQAEIGIVGKTEALQEVVERIAQIAAVGSTVLITGESGTGKELVARGLHRLSPRRGRPFIAVNIAALPETLLESELFGHEKGAFTGASSLRKGMFELANGGTIFLDEVAEMPPGSQTRLLRVLEQREFMRVGGSDSIRVDVRVIAATNRDLRQAVALNEFRRDLYYRLNVLHIHMPPLRERPEDIPLLVHEFIRELSREHQREFKGIAPEAMEILVQYDWPGNVRELSNLVESMVVLAPGSTIRPVDIPPDVRRGTGRGAAGQFPAPPLALRRADVAGREGSAQLPQMEFVFRTLVDLKYDIEDIRREFEMYKRRHPELTAAREAGVVEVPRARFEPTQVEQAKVVTVTEEAPTATTAEASESEEGVIHFRPGMTMEELERAAIIATLESVGGNRRRASEQLGIGERTLYRKLKEYKIDA
ncbi:MAG: sigma-54-dependent Fis family transcriptional regulator [Gemmatimonadota bacterium]|nr:MAG: sigma-54-dependent Fis family transcriptional regulator [Gemmatimonadota bacterium]